jgi:hypothetical protein
MQAWVLALLWGVVLCGQPPSTVWLVRSRAIMA